MVSPGYHYIGIEIEYFFQLPECEVKKLSDLARQAPQKRDVRDRGGRADVSYVLAAYLGVNHLDPAFFATTPRCFIRLYLPQLHS